MLKTRAQERILRKIILQMIRDPRMFGPLLCKGILSHEKLETRVLAVQLIRIT